jgi:ATP synthase protein I
MKYSKMWDMSSIALTIPSSIAVGLFFGYWLDKWLGTKPWLIIVFTLLGVASGLMTFVRQALKINREDEKDAAAEEKKARGGRGGPDGGSGDPEG